MEVYCIFITVALSLFINVQCEIDTNEVRNLYCVDPHTGVYYPVYSTWPSTTFCGTYTCNVRTVNKKGMDSYKETVLDKVLAKDNDEYNTNVEDLYSNDDKIEDVSYNNPQANLSNPIETVQLYKAAKNLLAILENNSNLKNKKQPRKETDNKKLGSKGSINLSKPQLDLLFNSAKNLMLQLEDRLKSVDDLSEENIKDLENLLKVSSKISNITGRKINDRKENVHLLRDLESDPKLVEYMKQYNEYMQDYQNALEQYSSESDKPTKCDIFKDAMNNSDCDMNSSDTRNMFIYMDENGTVKQLATPKHVNKSCLGTYLSSDSEFNYWKIDEAKLGKNHVHKRDTEAISNSRNAVKDTFERFQKELADKCYCLYNLILPHTGMEPLSHYDGSCNQCSVADIHNYISNISISDLTSDDGSLSSNNDPLLLSKFHSAMIAYKQFYDYYMENYGMKNNEPKPTIRADEVTRKATTENRYVLRGTTIKPNIVQPINPPTTQLPKLLKPTESTIITATNKILHKYDENTLRDIYSKLSYYEYDPISNSYVTIPPKDDAEYEKFMNEYNSIFPRLGLVPTTLTPSPIIVRTTKEVTTPSTSTSTSTTTTTERPTSTIRTIDVMDDGMGDFALIAELLGFNNAKKRWPIYRNQIKEKINQNKAENDPLKESMSENKLVIVDDHKIITTPAYTENEELPSVSKYIYDKVTGKYVAKHLKNDDVVLKKYDAVVNKIKPAKTHDMDEDDLSPEASEHIKRVVIPIQDYNRAILKNMNSPQTNNDFSKSFDTFVHQKSKPKVERPNVIKDDDVLLELITPINLSGHLTPLSSASVKNVHTSYFPNLPFTGAGRTKRSTQYGRRNERVQAYITVKGCPESVEPGFYRHGQAGSFYPKCCPQRIP